MLNGDHSELEERSMTLKAAVKPNANTLEDKKQKRQGGSGCFSLIVDMGCSTTSTGYKEDFVQDTLRPLKSVISGISGISGDMKISHEGIARYEVLDDKNNIQVLQLHAFLVPNMRTRLLSPQALFQELRRNKKDLYGKLKLEMDADTLRIKWPDENITTVSYDCCTRMPKLLACHDARHMRFNTVNNGCVTSLSNTNLTPGQKEILKWHYKMGHLDFQWVQWLNANKMFGSTNIPTTKLPAIKCEACQLGKQQRRPTGHTHVQHRNKGKLKKAVTEPGERIFMDSYVSRQPGRAFTGRGVSSGSQFQGGTIFAYAATGYVFVSHQVGQTAAEALESKMRFEREAATCGVTVKSELLEKGQGVTFKMAQRKTQSRM
jgi:GAG-pre-integrase domain